MAKTRKAKSETGQKNLIPVWIIEDDQYLNGIIKRTLQKQGFNCISFLSAKETSDHINTFPGGKINAIMLIDYLLGESDAVKLLNEINELGYSIPFVVMTGQGSQKTAVELMKLGAMDYVIKEDDFVDQIVRSLMHVTEKIAVNRKLEESKKKLKSNAEKLKALNDEIIMQKILVENEKAKTDKLLQSILPLKIANELLDKGYTKPREYDSVSILFADVIGFSDLAKSSPAIELVTRLDNYFYIFDEIIEQFGLEKIKTIGDCYMCAGGIPEENNHNAVIAVIVGLKIQATTLSLLDENDESLPSFRLRLGIHSGPVVAGVVGKNKFVYDIWGDAVNIASRIVEASERDKVNISEETYKLVKKYFIFSERGEIITKRNYPIKMYFVERLKPEYSADDEGLSPSKKLLKELNINQGVKYY
ncbi:MAG: response regulator [Bacteroidales bacterium]|nr:response regulator [Bacteroidales bacterium]